MYHCFVIVIQAVMIRVLDDHIRSYVAFLKVSQAVAVGVFVAVKYSVAVSVLKQRIVVEPAELFIVA